MPGNAGSAAVEKIDVEAVNAATRRPLYAKREKIFPRAVTGRYRSVKWAILCITLGLYYILPWIRWDRGAASPDQAVLFDFPAGRFYFFFVEIWPHEVYYITGLLIIAALTLFLVTSIAGRIWCGYSCPQTLWTDLFLWVERCIEGDRNARIRLERAQWTGLKLFRRILKHAAWILIALATGGAWVFYFGDAPTLLAALFALEAPPVAYVFIGLLTFTTYLLAGHAREQVCTYMCPWPRIQGAMLDQHSMLVTYRTGRGEPRGSHRRGDSWSGRGDCVDCNTCVAACPMGIDIRDGNQLECINCGLCIDACDSIMDRIGRPRGLIAYDTIAGQEAGDSSPVGTSRRPLRLVRPRTILYGVLIAVVSGVMLASLMTRTDTEVSVIRDRSPLFVRLSGGGYQNGYTIRILNKKHKTRRFLISAVGLPDARIAVVGAGPDAIEVGPDRLRSLRVHVSVPQASIRQSRTDFDVVVTDHATGNKYAHATTFRSGE